MKVKKIKICAVCEDIAIANNFGALTCKSCKPFFRRNAIKNKIFKCKGGDNKCRINKNTRKKCRKCRLDKCYAIGMKKELILSDNQKHIRKRVIQENREKRQKIKEADKTNDCLDENKSIDEIERKSNADSGYCSEVSLLDQTFDNDINEDQISVFEGFLEINQLLRKCSESYKQTIDLIIDRPVNHYHIRYTELEEYKIRELFYLFKPIANFWVKNPNITDVVCLSEVPKFNNHFYEKEATNLIKVVNTINFFEDICINDKIALVKYSFLDIISLRSIICYNLEDESWKFSMDEGRTVLFPMDVLKSLKNDVYVIYKTHLNDIIKECESDSVIIDLLTAIALFNPNRPNLINKEIVRVQQYVYLYLLRRYLTFKYQTETESELKSAKLLNILISANFLGQLEKKFFFDDYQEQYGPLVKEIFNK